MSTFYFDADIIHDASQSTIKHAYTADDSNTYKTGDIIKSWDHVFRWDEDCIPNAKMVEWRFRGDNLADAALPTIMSLAGDAGGTDLLSRLEAVTRTTTVASQTAQSPLAPPTYEASALWHQLHSIDDNKLFQYDRDQIARGQAVFYRYAPHILLSLLQFSLAAGFSSPRISRVLNLGSYLVPPMSSTPAGEAPRISPASNDRTFMRLMETTQFVVDCMSEGAMEVGGPGWKAAIRVRLLHANIRLKIINKIRAAKEKKGYFAAYDETRDGIPISQEDYSATLSAFSTAPLIALIKVGIMPSAQECEDFTALWKVIGYYLGVDEDILENHFSNWHQSTRMLASAMVNIFAGESDPPPPTNLPLENLVRKQDQVIHVNLKSTNDDPYTSPATLPVLFSVCNRWPSPWSLVDHCAASRQYVGPTLSDWLSIPKTSWVEWFKLQFGYALANIPPKLARIYRKGWDARRREAMQESVESAVMLELGNRLTKFRPRTELDVFEPQKEVDEFGAFKRGSILGIGWKLGLVYGEMALVLLPFTPLMPFYAAWVTWGIFQRAIERARAGT